MGTLQVVILIFLNTNYGESHYVPVERTSELRIQPVTAIKVKMNVHELQLTTVDGAKGRDIDEEKFVDIMNDSPDTYETTQDMNINGYLKQDMEKLKENVQVDVHIEETEDFDDSEWSDTESVKSFGTMTYS